MKHDIAFHELPETTFLYQEARCEHAKIAETLGQLLPACFGYAMKSGLQMVSPPMTVYVQWGPGMVTMRAGLAVAPGSKGEGAFKIEVLPAGRAAITVHTGPYEGLGEAHAALEQFLAAEGAEASGPPREVYLTDPGEVPDPAEWKTQVVLPAQ